MRFRVKIKNNKKKGWDRVDATVCCEPWIRVLLSYSSYTSTCNPRPTHLAAVWGDASTANVFPFYLIVSDQLTCERTVIARESCTRKWLQGQVLIWTVVSLTAVNGLTCANSIYKSAKSAVQVPKRNTKTRCEKEEREYESTNRQETRTECSLWPFNQKKKKKNEVRVISAIPSYLGEKSAAGETKRTNGVGTS